MNSHLLLAVAALCLGASTVSARNINITMLANCRDMATDPVAYFTAVDYHYSDEDGLCDQVHADVVITTRDPSPLNLYMTLFKCEEKGMTVPCEQNPTEHEELMTCERLMNDDSGPWHMFTSVMEDDFKCGRKMGTIKLEFARLRLEHLMKYLDVYDSKYNSFSLKMNFFSTSTNLVRGCGELDFTLN